MLIDTSAHVLAFEFCFAEFQMPNGLDMAAEFCECHGRFSTVVRRICESQSDVECYIFHFDKKADSRKSDREKSAQRTSIREF